MTPPTKPPADNRLRVPRGGTWRITTATNVRAAFRYGNTPSYRSYYIGFRCAQRGARMTLVKVTP